MNYYVGTKFKIKKYYIEIRFEYGAAFFYNIEARNEQEAILKAGWAHCEKEHGINQSIKYISIDEIE